MTFKDLMTVITLIVLSIFIIVLLILWKQGKVKRETWPRVVGISAGVSLFIPLMIQTLLSRSLSELPGDIATNVILSLAIGIASYFNVRKIINTKRNNH